MLWCRPEDSEKLVREFLSTGPAVRRRMMKNWGVVGGIAAAVAAGVYILWGPIAAQKKRKRGMVPGLLNLGNTCFMNSLLQGLAACPSFIGWLESFSRRTGGQSSQDKQLSSTLLHLLKALSRDEPGEDEVLDAGCLLDVLRLYRWHISSSEEQDAHELFHVLTSSLEEERDRLPRVSHLFDVESLEATPLHPIPSPWKLQHPFHGRLTSNMLCKRCKHQSPVRYDSFESLSLPIPCPQWLQGGSRDKGHFLENQRTTFIKQLKLGKSTCSSSRRAGAPWRHALWTLHHLPPLPRPARGHTPSQWLWVSDDSVRKASLQEALSSNAYLIFYERVQRLSLAFQARGVGTYGARQ
ncbi:hypothetical protein CRUP_021152 [Coryphaenoides rupestris]|nr:hypothetical protein CRUP_021152 [Coryphaenoides rupestris]